MGVARSDPGGTLAVPVETVPRNPETLSRIADLVHDLDAVEVVVGYPLSLNGTVGPAAHKAQDFASRLAAVLAERRLLVSVRLVDERLTTVSAERVLRAGGRNRARRRAVVDQAAAVVLLQHALDVEDATGRPAGQEVRQVP